MPFAQTLPASMEVVEDFRESNEKKCKDRVITLFTQFYASILVNPPQNLLLWWRTNPLEQIMKNKENQTDHLMRCLQDSQTKLQDTQTKLQGIEEKLNVCFQEIQEMKNEAIEKRSVILSCLDGMKDTRL